MAFSFCWGTEAARVDPATGLVTEQGAGREPTGLRTQVFFSGESELELSQLPALDVSPKFWGGRA